MREFPLILLYSVSDNILKVVNCVSFLALQTSFVVNIIEKNSEKIPDVPLNKI